MLCGVSEPPEPAVLSHKDTPGPRDPHVVPPGPVGQRSSCAPAVR